MNGHAIAKSEMAGTYASIKRTWKKGDKLEFDLPMSLHPEATPDDPKKVAILYGPVVSPPTWATPRTARRRRGVGRTAPGAIFRTPVLVTEGRPLDQWLKPVPGKPLTFRAATA